ncbi:hypothetical protein OUZ56_018891 [Daphnia magna]|uniref:Uncharacterized protein n=1 Tax=Daphnia magna TaxID=35525 RepID=A0ABQ9ZB57_9CRUS|nr:hypothetical protein OUZ56_018891 [Daphnia magna]
MTGEDAECLKVYYSRTFPELDKYYWHPKLVYIEQQQRSWFLHKTLQPQQTNLDTNEIFAFVENVQRRMFYCSIGSAPISHNRVKRPVPGKGNRG